MPEAMLHNAAVLLDWLLRLLYVFLLVLFFGMTPIFGAMQKQCRNMHKLADLDAMCTMLNVHGAQLLLHQSRASQKPCLVTNTPTAACVRICSSKNHILA